MTIFSLRETPYVEINITDAYILRFYKQDNGSYICTLADWMLPDLKEITDRYNRKIKLFEGK